MLPVRYQLRDNWPVINGSPLAYLVALRNGMNDSAVYPPDRPARPESKMEFDAIVARNGGRVPQTVARIADGKAFAPSGAAQELGVFLRRLPAGRYFLKPDVGKGGAGAHRLESAETGLSIDGRDASFEALMRIVSAEPYLLQESLIPFQHPLQARYSADVISTIRLMVFDTNKGAVTAGGFMRLAGSSAAVDNYSQGGIAVAIDLEQAVLRPDGVVEPRFTGTTVHAGSGLGLKDQPVPHLEEATALVTRLQGRLGMKSLGWDVALLQDGPCIVEANRTWDVHLPMRIIPGFYDSFLRYQLNEPVEATARFEFAGDFPDRKLARHWLSYLLGQSLVSGCLEHLSRHHVVLTLAGSRRAMEAVAQRLQREAGHFHISKVRVVKSDARIRPGFDVEASFAAPAETQPAATA
jgi:hypothetical protein